MTIPAQIWHLSYPIDLTYPEFLAGHPLNAQVDFLELGRYEDGEPVDPASKFDLFIKTPIRIDVVWAGAMPYVSDRLREVLAGVAGDCLSFLPLTVNGEPYWVLKVNRQIDALDDETEIDRAPDGRIRSIERAVWAGDKINGPAIFTIPQVRRRIWATPEVVEAYERSGCNGLGFRPSGRVV
jgi:hypothetical protein